jgi:hypothetical protein
MRVWAAFHNQFAFEYGAANFSDIANEPFGSFGYPSVGVVPNGFDQAWGSIAVFVGPPEKGAHSGRGEHGVSDVVLVGHLLALEAAHQCVKGALFEGDVIVDLCPEVETLFFEAGQGYLASGCNADVFLKLYVGEV